MEINKLILVVKEKLEKNISIEEIIVEDKTFLHKNHSSHQKEKYHLKLQIKSKELKVTTNIFCICFFSESLLK